LTTSNAETNANFLKKLWRNADLLLRVKRFEIGSSALIAEPAKGGCELRLRASSAALESGHKLVLMHPDAPWFGHMVDERMAAAIGPGHLFIAGSCNAAADGAIEFFRIHSLSTQDKEKSGAGIVTLSCSGNRADKIQLWRRFAVDTRSDRLMKISELFAKPGVGFQLRIVKSGQVRALSPCIDEIVENGAMRMVGPEDFLSECERFSSMPRLKGKVEACIYESFGASKFNKAFELAEGSREHRMATCGSFLARGGAAQTGKNLAVQHGIWLLTPDAVEDDGSIIRKQFVQRLFLSGYLGNVHQYVHGSDSGSVTIGPELAPNGERVNR
jgi:hypothetical protein